MLDREAPGYRGGDPRRRAHPNAARDALAWSRRSTRSDADREHARVAGRLPGRLRGAAACTRPWARARGRRPELVAQADMSTTALSLPRRFASLVKFEHTIFALPFAYVGAFLAVDGYPGTEPLIWLTLAMIGARTLAMALNRLVDAELDARNPRTASREIPAGIADPRPGLGALRRCARALPRGSVPARADRALALADSGRDVRHLSLFEAGHVALPPLARRVHGTCAARRLARRDGVGAVGGLGTVRCAGSLGRRDSTSSTRSSTSPTTRPPASARGPPDSASAACSPGRVRLPRHCRRCCSRRSVSGSAATSSTGSASWPSPACSSTSTPSCSPGDLRRLDAAFFTVNGVISVVFFVFVVLATTV